MLAAQNLQIRCLHSRISVRSSAIAALNPARSNDFKAQISSFSRHADVAARAVRGPGRPLESPSDQPGDEYDEFEDVDDFIADGEDFEEPTQELLEKLQGDLGLYEEDEGEDEQEAREERLRLEQEAESSFPEPDERGYYLYDLYGKAAYVDASLMMEHDFPDAVVYGIQSNPEKVFPGDLYACCTSGDNQQVPAMIQEALERGAFSLLLPSDAQNMEGLSIPPEIACHYVPNVPEVAHRLAVAFYDAPGRDLTVVGVTGSHGKTTVSWLICGILEAMEQITGTLNSIGYSMSGDLLDIDGDLWQAPEGDPADSQESSAPFRITPYHPGRYDTAMPSTPSGLQVQKLLGSMRDRGATCAVLECSDVGIATGDLGFIDMAVVVHTNFTGSGAERAPFGGDREKVLEAQLGLFDTLLDASAQAAVINLDDPIAFQLMEQVRGFPVVTYGIENAEADVVAESARFTIWESEIIVQTPLGKLQIISPLLGKHNVYNILAAVATGIALKVPLKSIVAGIEAVEVIPGRCEVVDEGQEFSVIVDAASTPEALDAMLSTLRGNAKNIFTVFGCQGERDRTVRPKMAEVAHAKSDFVLMCNDSPRREDPAQIMQDMVAGLPDEIVNKYSGYVYFPFQDQGHVPLWFEPYLQKAQRDVKRYIMEDRFSAIRAAIGTAAPGDVVVIAGRGHCDYMEYWDGEDGVEKGWMDDRVEARSALQKLSILQQLDGKLDRKTLPWGKALDEMDVSGS